MIRIYANAAGVIVRKAQTDDTTDETNAAITPANIQAAIDLISTRLTGCAGLSAQYDGVAP